MAEVAFDDTVGLGSNQQMGIYQGTTSLIGGFESPEIDMGGPGLFDVHLMIVRIAALVGGAMSLETYDGTVWVETPLIAKSGGASDDLTISDGGTSILHGAGSGSHHRLVPSFTGKFRLHFDAAISTGSVSSLLVSVKRV